MTPKICETVLTLHLNIVIFNLITRLIERIKIGKTLRYILASIILEVIKHCCTVFSNMTTKYKDLFETAIFYTL